MKRIVTLLFIAIFAYPFATAQVADSSQSQQEEIDQLRSQVEELKAEKEQQEYDATQQRIWGKGRFTRLGYAIAQTSGLDGAIEKSDFAFYFQKGTTYRLHKKPIAKMIKFGLDVVWFDIQFSKYKTTDDAATKWTSEFEDIPQSNNGGNYDDDDSFNIDLGKSALNIGMGIGPNICVAPFSLSSSKALQPLRVSAYFHYSPTVSMYMMSYDGEVEVSTGFCNMFNLGCVLQYRAIGLGVEGRWGQGKFKPLDFDSMFGDDEEFVDNSDFDNKYSRRFANTRLFLQFTF